MIHTNPATADLLGTSVAGLEPGSILENTGPEDGPALSRLIADAKTDKPPREIELDVRTQDGRSIPVAIRACLIAFAEQNATYLLVRDVTESQRAREEILEANRKLKEQDRLKSDFLNTVSHELRTPLTSIKWSTESLLGLNKNWDEETYQKLLRIIRDDNQRLINLIEQLLS